MKIAWTPRAIEHLVALRDYIANDRPDSATNIAARIVETVDLLTQNPSMGRIGRIRGTRELVIAGTPYIVPYRVREERIELLAVFHGKQKWPKRL